MNHQEEGSAKHSSEQIDKFLQGQKKGTRRQQLQSARKKMKRNIKSKGPRNKNTPFNDMDDSDGLDYLQHERIMPLDERDRRRELERGAFGPYDTATDALEVGSLTTEGLNGLVISVSAGLCIVDLNGSTLSCSIRGTITSLESGYTNMIAVGDEVVVSEDGAGRGVVEAVLPRRSALTRPDVFRSHRRQVIAANVEQLLIVSSWREPNIWLELIDRYLIAAERNYLSPIICVNKTDLVEDEAVLEATFQPYRTLGYRLVMTSARANEGIDELRTILRDHSTVVAGLSGTGKSSLLTAIQPGLQLRTGEVNEHSGEGKHTTTQAVLLRLNEGGYVVDTPGIREFGLSGLRRQSLQAFSLACVVTSLQAFSLKLLCCRRAADSTIAHISTNQTVLYSPRRQTGLSLLADIIAIS